MPGERAIPQVCKSACLEEFDGIDVLIEELLGFLMGFALSACVRGYCTTGDALKALAIAQTATLELTAEAEASRGCKGSLESQGILPGAQ